MSVLMGFRAVQARMEAARLEAIAREAQEKQRRRQEQEAADGDEHDPVGAMRREREEITTRRRHMWEAQGSFNAEAEAMRRRFDERRRRAAAEEAVAARGDDEASDLSRWLREEIMNQPPSGALGGSSSPSASAVAQAKQGAPPAEGAQVVPLPYEFLLENRRREVDGDEPLRGHGAASDVDTALVDASASLTAQPPAISAPQRARAADHNEALGEERDYYVDNDLLQSSAPGVTLRFSKHLDDRDEEAALVPWGVILRGCEAGDGWVKVGHHYLPIFVQGLAVLVACNPDGSIPGEEGQEVVQEVPLDPFNNPRGVWRAEAARQEEELRQAIEEKQREELKLEAQVVLAEKAAQLEEARRRAEDSFVLKKEALASDARRELAASASDEDHYSVLGIERHATEEEVTRAYRSSARLYHPDKTIDQDPATRLVRQQQMARLTIAYKVLSSANQRWHYDRSLAQDRGDKVAAERGAAAAAAAKAPCGQSGVVAVSTNAPQDRHLEEDFDFSSAGDDAPFRRAFGRAARVCYDSGSMRKERVRLALAQLRGQAEMKYGINESDTDIYGYEVVRHIGPYSPFAGLGETGQSHRLAKAEVRTPFRDFLVERVTQAVKIGSQWWDLQHGLRYASLGSGELLFDLELLERLRLAGVRIAQVCAIDRAYRAPTANTRRALREFADWQRCATQLLRHEPVEVLVFGSLKEYFRATEKEKYGPAAGCHLFVHCDAYWPGALADGERLAAHALAPGGLFARLSDRQEDENMPSVSLRGCGIFRPFHGDSDEVAVASEPKFQSLEEALAAGSRAFLVTAWVSEVLPPECCRSPTLRPVEDLPVDIAGGCATSKSPARRRAEELGLSLWRVAHRPRIAVRASPAAGAAAVDVFFAGDEVIASGEVHGPWLRLAKASWPEAGDAPDEAWVLRDGASIGLGKLLELVYSSGPPELADEH